ncbi:MAG: hypothetical protein NT130_04005 [Candidatus Micrarchaeota archaeon]|nr:hypothetical protein [Candidatus Micrarchaeota archaeon]
MAKKKGKQSEFDLRLIIIGLISGMFAIFSVMCIPCIMAAYPSIGLFFAFLGVLSILLSRYSWVLLAIGVLLIAIAMLLQVSRKNKCE